MRFPILLLLAAIPGFVLATTARPESEQSLDGEWQIVFDHDNEGRGKQWFLNEHFPTEQQRPIAVPSCWELIEKDYEGVAFYRRTFTTPAEWRNKLVRLQFDAVNFRSEVWVNDTAVGVHDGGFTPFEFRVDDLLKFGEENTLILRVVGPILLQDKVVDGMGPMETPQWRGAITGGIWQSVRLVASGEVFVKDVFIEPKIKSNTAEFHVELSNESTREAFTMVKVTIHETRQPDKVVVDAVASLDLTPGIHKKHFVLKIPDAVHWSPDNPHLYQVKVTVISDTAGTDHWSTRFGMRQFTIHDKKFHLNGKPLYLKATFFEGLYPTKLASPDSREMAIREIQLAKDAGFNMIRPWRKPPPPMWLDLADEMGVLTVGSLVVECMDLPIQSPQLPDWVENEVRESILRDRNRTCVVQWELFNELKRPVLMRLLHPMAMLARELDPTRLILDESGGWAQGANIFLPYVSEPIQFNDIHDYPGPQISEMVYDKLRLTGDVTHDGLKAMGLTGRMPGKNAKAANQPRILSIRTIPRNVYAGKAMRIEVAGVNELEPFPGTFTVDVVAPDGSIVHSVSKQTALTPGITPLFYQHINTTALRGTYNVRAYLISEKGKRLVGNQRTFEVFSEDDLVPPKTRIALLDSSLSLSPFLRLREIPYEAFDENTPVSRPVFVSKTKAVDAAHRMQFDQLAEFIKAGGTAVYLEGGGRAVRWGTPGKASPLLPVATRSKQAIGTWTCISHIVKKHPIFDGLPVNQSMGTIYENVWAPNTLLDFEGEIIAGSIGYDWFPDYDLSKRHYYGTGDTWWGADVGVAKIGKGRCIASQLRLLEHLGTDPVADKILFNMIRWVAGSERTKQSPQAPTTAE